MKLKSIIVYILVVLIQTLLCGCLAVTIMFGFASLMDYFNSLDAYTFTTNDVAIFFLVIATLGKIIYNGIVTIAKWLDKEL